MRENPCCEIVASAAAAGFERRRPRGLLAGAGSVAKKRITGRLSRLLMKKIIYFFGEYRKIVDPTALTY